MKKFVFDKSNPLDSSKQNRCPRCHVILREDYYEGTPIKICPQCSGKLVDSSFKWRILSRREVTFSENLIKKAYDFKSFLGVRSCFLLF
jgi:NAD-dependent SIR2 family protein deacetylase